MKFDINKFNEIFQTAIKYYHLKDSVNQEFKTPYDNPEDFEAILYRKCWIDSVQWHLEDIIRDPEIIPEEALKIKRRIDNLNQKRTDLVEDIDEYIFNQYKHIETKSDARLNTETPGWAIDRLSILNLKIYHWKEETERTDASKEHIEFAKNKLQLLYNQRKDLSLAIKQLLDELEQGKVIAKTYKQLKMYNDPNLNPVLRKSNKGGNEYFSV